MAPPISSLPPIGAHSSFGTTCARAESLPVRSKTGELLIMRLPAIALLFLASGPVGDAQTDWPAYGHDPGGLQYSPLKQIDTTNAGKLQIAWTYDTRPAATPASEGVPAKAAPRNRPSQATPLVVAGVLYLSTPYGRVVAL